MATVAARLSVLGESTFGTEKEKDANSMLLELERGLRSTKVGEQCEAIVKFPRLFEKYPFPIVINGALLKLADVFRVGSNFLRLCILRVTQQSEKHLDKITNIDEFVRRIYSVIHSNDPVARALTLRVLGSVAGIISDRKNVHHSIMNGLDSNDAVELEAAISAAARYAETSKSFACGISNKIALMVESPATTVDMKLKLMPLFEHMHHDSSTMLKVRILSGELMKRYPSRGFIMITLHTLSCLAAKSLIDIPLQIELLMHYLVNDVRMPVRIVILKDLKLLAKKGPHMWSSSMIDALVTFVLSTPYEGLQYGGLVVLTTISRDVGIINFKYDEDSAVRQCCSRYAYHSNIKLASESTQLLAHIAIQARGISGNSDVAQEIALEAATALESFICCLKSTHINDDSDAIKGALLVVVQLCTACPNITDTFVDTITSTLLQTDEDTSILLCECLSAISSLRNDLLKSLNSDIIEIIISSKDKPKLLLQLVTILFQAHVEDGIPEDALTEIEKMIADGDAWILYRIGRQATRYGHHGIAATIFKHLTTKVSSEHYNFWLSSLREACQAECHFHGDEVLSVTQFVQRVAKAEINLHNSIAALKAATTPGNPLVFQTEYLTLYTQMLQAYTQVVRTCCSFQTCPPPAIATSLAMTTGDDLHRCDHVIAQMQKSIDHLQCLCNKYEHLYTSSFDADPNSLLNIHILQQSCQVMIHVLKTALIQSKRQSSSEIEGVPPFEFPTKGLHIENHQMIAVCESLVVELEGIYSTKSDAPITHKHIAFIQNTAMKLCRVPLYFPRYFFQSVQATEIKVAISPQPRAGDTINIHYDTHLTFKVEGVVQHGTKREMFRNVHQISIYINSTLQSKGKMVKESKLSAPPKNDLKETVRPHNDFFTCQFLLTFPIAGLYTINVRTAIVDADGIEWNTGPKMTVSLKSYDEAVQRQQQQQYANQRQQQRAAAAMHHI